MRLRTSQLASIRMAHSKALEYYEAEMVATINEIRLQDQSKVGAVTIFRQLFDKLVEYGMMKPVQTHLNPKKVLVHPKNRSGLGIHGKNAHENADTVLGMGADRKHASKNSYCFELPPTRSKRVESFAFNERLAENSEGILAKPFGDETHESVGGGHMCGFCRATEARCKTPIKRLQDKDGRIDYDKVML